MSILEIIILAFVVHIVLNYFFFRRKQAILQYRLQTAIDQIQKNTVICSIELYDGLIYLWEDETKKFITQGATIEELKDNCLKYYPNTAFVISGDEFTVADEQSAKQP
jgi:hypothetical protein